MSRQTKGPVSRAGNRVGDNENKAPKRGRPAC